jgi:HlyD family secretion protein
VGQNVDFTVDAYPFRTFHGTVTQVRNAPTTVNNVVTYDCVIGVTNADYKLKPGMTANVSIVIAQRHDILEIPNGALRFRPPENAVVETNAPAAASAHTNAAAVGIAGGPRGGFGQGGGPRGGFGQGGGQRGGFGRSGGRGGEHQFVHTVYVLTGDGPNASLKMVPIRTGISDGIDTEVLDGLKEGDRVVTGLAVATADASAPSGNPFSGGFPRGPRR